MATWPPRRWPDAARLRQNDHAPVRVAGEEPLDAILPLRQAIAREDAPAARGQCRIGAPGHQFVTKQSVNTLKKIGHNSSPFRSCRSFQQI